MFTSYFGNLKKIPPDLEPVGISQGVPRWYRGRVEKVLAPSRAMLKLTRPDYDREFAALLAGLDPQTLYSLLGENTVLLCWETPGQGCHRRIVAEWLEARLGIEVPELGFARPEAKPYAETPWKPAAPPRTRASRSRDAGLDLWSQLP